ncbi:MAG: hypothetical protein ACK5YR_01100 [Pirellula sp.]|jgi:hypothetical protein
MIWALIRKDLSLLRLYLRSLVGALIACFVAAAILIFWDIREVGQSFADSRFMIASILAGGSLPGLIIVTIFSALLSGSIITLERSDRSSQFLACLPPTRLQNYLSKLVVVASEVSLSLVICLLAWFIAYQLNHSGEMSLGSSELSKKFNETKHLPVLTAGLLRFANAWSDATLYQLFPLFAVLASTTGASLLASWGSRVNAVPAIFGLLTPIFVYVAIIVSVALLKLMSFEEAFKLFSFVATGFGLCCIVASGCIYRVQREF